MPVHGPQTIYCCPSALTIHVFYANAWTTHNMSLLMFDWCSYVFFFLIFPYEFLLVSNDVFYDALWLPYDFLLIFFSFLIWMCLVFMWCSDYFYDSHMFFHLSMNWCWCSFIFMRLLFELWFIIIWMSLISLWFYAECIWFLYDVLLISIDVLMNFFDVSMMFCLMCLMII